MKRFNTALSLSLAAAMLASSCGAFAQEQRPDARGDGHEQHNGQQGGQQGGGDHHAARHDQPNGGGHAYVEHHEWRKGAQMRSEDWQRGERIDYRGHHLNRPPRGYEWREVDGNYVLASIASGLITSVIIAAGH